jgi:hypothetical protein
MARVTTAAGGDSPNRQLIDADCEAKIDNRKSLSTREQLQPALFFLLVRCSRTTLTVRELAGHLVCLHPRKRLQPPHGVQRIASVPELRDLCESAVGI